MQKLLAKFFDMFQELDQLSPVKEIEHQIPLKEWTKSVNVWPY